MAMMLVRLLTVTEPAGREAKVDGGTGQKVVPAMETAVPPLVGPALGAMPVNPTGADLDDGEGSIIDS